mmetsp:Transcript_580/g.1582  ORF Transcript_580/g.1582 Transcript_580/m.1582 type:complete len:403 (-) Transcript_580:477-1685(-)
MPPSYVGRRGVALLVEKVVRELVEVETHGFAIPLLRKEDGICTLLVHHLGKLPHVSRPRARSVDALDILVVGVGDGAVLAGNGVFRARPPAAFVGDGLGKPPAAVELRPRRLTEGVHLPLDLTAVGEGVRVLQPGQHDHLAAEHVLAARQDPTRKGVKPGGLVEGKSLLNLLRRGHVLLHDLAAICSPGRERVLVHRRVELRYRVSCLPHGEVVKEDNVGGLGAELLEHQRKLAHLGPARREVEDRSPPVRDHPRPAPGGHDAVNVRAGGQVLPSRGGATTIGELMQKAHQHPAVVCLAADRLEAERVFACVRHGRARNAAHVEDQVTVLRFCKRRPRGNLSFRVYQKLRGEMCPHKGVVLIDDPLRECSHAELLERPPAGCNALCSIGTLAGHYNGADAVE